MYNTKRLTPETRESTETQNQTVPSKKARKSEQITAQGTEYSDIPALPENMPTANMASSTDDLEKLPEEIVTHICRFFKPRELARFQQTAHRYNKLGKQIKVEAEKALGLQFFNDAKVIEEEAAIIGKKLKEKYFEGISGYAVGVDIEKTDEEVEMNIVDATIKKVIIKARKYITNDRSLDNERYFKGFIKGICYYTVHKNFMYAHQDFMQHQFKEITRHGWYDNYIGYALGSANAMKKYLDDIKPVFEKLAILTRTYQNHYRNSILQHQTSSCDNQKLVRQKSS